LKKDVLHVYLILGTRLALQCSLIAGRLTSGLHSAAFIVSVGAILQAVVLFWLLFFYRYGICKLYFSCACGSTVFYIFTHLYPANSPMSGLLGAAIPLFIGALWGVGDGVLNTQLSALLGLLFEDVKVILFSACI